MLEEMEMAGNGHTNATAGVTTTIRARVFSGPNGTGELLADLGTIVGPRTKAEGRKTNKLLKMLKVAKDKEVKRLKEMKHG